MNSLPNINSNIENITDVPGILKRLIRTIAYTFYQPCHIAIFNVLLRHIVVDEDSLSLLLKIDKKQLRSMIQPLKLDKLIRFIMMKEKIEESGQYLSFTYYYINYPLYLNIIKYKLESMKRKIVHTESSNRLRPNYTCSNCGKGFTDLDMSRLINMKTGELTCYLCFQPVNENEESKQQIMSRTLLAKFNQQFNYLYKLIDKCCSVDFDDKLNEPIITKFHVQRAIISRNSSDMGVLEMFHVNQNQNAKTKRLLSNNNYQQHLSIKFDEIDQHNNTRGISTIIDTTTSKQLPEWLKNNNIDLTNNLNNNSILNHGIKEKSQHFMSQTTINESANISNVDDYTKKNDNQIDDIEEMLRIEMEGNLSNNNSDNEHNILTNNNNNNNNRSMINEENLDINKLAVVDTSNINNNDNTNNKNFMNESLFTTAAATTTTTAIDVENDDDDLNLYMTYKGSKIHFNDITSDMLEGMNDEERENYTTILNSIDPTFF